MDQDKMTKRELQEQRRREKLEQSMQGKGSSSAAKWIILLVAAAIFVGFFGFILYSAKQNKDKPVALSAAGYVRGSGKVTLVEFGDLQCPACKAYEPWVRTLSHDFNGKMKLIYKNFPLVSVHPNALMAAHSAVAAGNQGKFWEMHDWLYDNQDSWGELPGADARAKIIAAAKGMGLDMTQFNKDIDASATDGVVSATENEGIAQGVDATPTFYIDNQKVDTNPQTYNDFKKLVQAEVDKVNSK